MQEVEKAKHGVEWDHAAIIDWIEREHKKETWGAEKDWVRAKDFALTARST